VNLQSNWKAEEIAFRSVGLEDKAVLGAYRWRHQHIFVQPGTDNSITPQQRIGQLESQNQQLLKEVQMWKNASLSFARDLRAARLGQSFLAAVAVPATVHDSFKEPA
jgi:hypothetical protein